MKALLLKILKKKKYKSEVVLTDDHFTAEYYSDSINNSLSWTLSGISESFATSNNLKSLTRGIYGRICTFSIIHIKNGKIKIFEYKEPTSSDYLFMTDAMVHVPESIMSEVRREVPAPIFMTK